MNPDVLLNRIRLEQRGLIDIHKKLYEMEHLTRRSTPTVTDEEALHESEVALLLHALAKRVTPQQMEIIRLRTKGYQTNEIAQMQNTSLYHVNTLLDNARFIVVELCRDS